MAGTADAGKPGAAQAPASELVLSARKLCKTYRVATRFSIYVGAQSLRAGMADLLDAAAAQFGDKDGAASATAGSSY